MSLQRRRAGRFGEQRAHREQRERFGQQVVVVDGDPRVVQVLFDMRGPGQQRIAEQRADVRLRPREQRVSAEQPREQAERYLLARRPVDAVARTGWQREIADLPGERACEPRRGFWKERGARAM